MSLSKITRKCQFYVSFEKNLKILIFGILRILIKNLNLENRVTLYIEK